MGAVSTYTFERAEILTSETGARRRVVVEITIDLDRVWNDVAYHAVHGKRGTVTRVRGAIVAKRKSSTPVVKPVQSMRDRSTDTR
jgi:hypothetical protein